jgi:acetylornithine/N-succinyldiaminopimelate aminotransferase
VSAAVIRYLAGRGIGRRVEAMGALALGRFAEWKTRFPDAVKDVRGRGLLLAVEFSGRETVSAINSAALEKGLILNIQFGTIIRIFPALTITETEMETALDSLQAIIEKVIHNGKKT